jgi:hypothetical protein
MAGDERRSPLHRARSTAILLGAIVACAAAVAAIVDLAGGPDLFGDIGTIVWALALAFFGVVTVRESDETRLRRLGAMTIAAAAVLIAVAVVELLT